MRTEVESNGRKVTAQEGAASPEEVYRERSARFARERDAYAAGWNAIANRRLLLFLAAVACVGWGIWQTVPPVAWLGGALFVAYLVLARYHGGLARLRDRNAELAKINDEAGKRLARRWDDLPVRHTTRADPHSPYAADLDIFGHASLFQLMDTTGTHMGEAILSRWLLEPAPPDAVRERQEAVAELAPLIDLRDELALRGRLLGEPKPDPEPFLAWAESEPWLVHRPAIVWGARLSVLLFWALAIAHATGLTSYPFWMIVGAANIIFTMTAGEKIYNILDRATSDEKSYRQYAEALGLISSASVQSPLLKRLQAELEASGMPAHDSIRHFDGLSRWLLPRDSQLYLPVEAITMWDVHLLRFFERWQVSSGKRARAWLRVLGEVEALSALAVLRHDHPAWAFPDLDPRALSFEARDLGHPLLPNETRVTNDVEVGPPGTFLLVTGSNMSGKSTLLRSLGVNVVLAQAGGPVCASACKLPPVDLWTSVRVQDSLEEGVSFFMAELMRLKQVVDAARRDHEIGERRVFYLLDEILQGTNTQERQIAARRVILHLVAQGALGAVSTHDLTLAGDPDIANAARLVHFRETILGGDDGHRMTFDYKLRSGLATSTNALRLMEIVGLGLDEERSVR